MFNCTFKIIFTHSVLINLILYFQQYLAQMFFNKWLLNGNEKKNNKNQKTCSSAQLWIRYHFNFTYYWNISQTRWLYPFSMARDSGITSAKPLDRCVSRLLFHISDRFHRRFRKRCSSLLHRNCFKWIATITCICWNI